MFFFLRKAWIDDNEYQIKYYYTWWNHSMQSVGSRLDLHDFKSGGRAVGLLE